MKEVWEWGELHRLSGGEVFNYTGVEVNLQFIPLSHLLLYIFVLDNRQTQGNGITEEVPIERFSYNA